MNFWYPLGFLGLLTIAVLILIYLLKPNFQQKVVSSTYVWKLSLKYRKKRIPVSRFRNILILICQVLILTLGAVILAQPFIQRPHEPEFVEKVIIIDAAANMQATQDNGLTRFENSVSEAKVSGKEILNGNGKVSVILAGINAEWVVTRLDSTKLAEFEAAMDELFAKDKQDELKYCTYSAADINGAVALADTVIEQNSDTEVVFYTATKYEDKANFDEVVNISSLYSLNPERNAAILNCKTYLEETEDPDDAEKIIVRLVVEVEVATYNFNSEIRVNLTIYGPNFDSELKEDAENKNPAPVSTHMDVRCSSDQPVTIYFDDLKTTEDSKRIYSYQSIYVEIDQNYIELNDSFLADNTFSLYGGIKDTINVYYYSTDQNVFFYGYLMTLRTELKSTWNINIIPNKRNEPIKNSGYDLYIYENEVPEDLPTDGAVLLANPNKIPSGMNMILDTAPTRTMTDDPFTFSSGASSPLMNHVNPLRIEVTEYTKVLSYDGFTPIMFCREEDPVMLVKNEIVAGVASKIVVMPFSLTKSNFALKIDFPIFLYNLFSYFLPPTLTKYSYNIGEEVVINARGTNVSVRDYQDIYQEELPYSFKAYIPGVYTIEQTLINGEPNFESFYVRIAATESDFSKIMPALTRLKAPPEPPPLDVNLLIWFAAALIALLFLEWWLQSREQF